LAGPIAAERLGIPWAALVLQPITFLSTYDPPVIAPAAWLRHLYPLGRFPFQAAMALGRAQLARWAEPMVALRKRVGLPTTAKNPLLVGQFSDYGTLALFSRAFATPQPDWPSRTCQTGFVFYDRLGIGLAPDANGESGLKDFLDEGPEPVLLTLGSSAVMHPGQFYSESVQAAQKLGLRAVLLVGPQAASDWNHLPSSMFAAGYVPFSEIMPRCALTVHQGGIGTTAQALRAGRPTLVVPWAHDQPDNAERLRKIGVSRTVPRSKYRAERIARELDTVLKKASYAEKARTVADQIAKENGTAAACDAIESLIASSVLSDALCGQRPDSQRTPR
ncbi:MAG: glycosyltransferase family 1 protein, partial [Acidobacteriaceae bacterium]|nr:glycosyltransferase family 1 protein [Acidobacteriaceae bacterium]